MTSFDRQTQKANCGFVKEKKCNQDLELTDSYGVLKSN